MRSAVLERRGIKPLLWPRNAGSSPGFVFTDAPLSLASGHFGLGNGGGAVMSFVEYLYELGK
jgi:hypothetical protein